MACYHPLQGFYSKNRNPNGKRGIVFNQNEGLVDRPVVLGCGQCIGCRLEKSRQWAIRCVHEAQMHTENAFITLTYNDENLPADLSVDKRHFQKFMKRLRKSIEPKKVRFFHAGEYGEELGRPHYHAIIFGHDFPDKKKWKKSNGQMLYRSDALEQLWPFGYCSIGAVTFESAAYVARYIVKKITGESADDHYQIVDKETGEITQRSPEYITMSRRPGIGKTWLDRYKSDVYPSDFVVLQARKLKPPKYYDNQMDLAEPEILKKIKSKRVQGAKKNSTNQTPERLITREYIQLNKLKQLKRTIK